MAVIKAGSEGELGPFTNTLDTSIGNDNNRRGSVVVGASEQYLIPFTTSATDLWVKVRWARSGAIGTDVDFIQLRAGTTQVLGIQADLTDTFRVRYRSAASGGTYSTYTAETFPVGAAVFQNADFRIQHLNGDTTYSFYINEILRYSQTVVGTVSIPDNILLQNFRTTATNYYQDVIVSETTPTVGMELVTMTPNGNGNYTAFTNDFSNIDDLGYNGATAIFTTSTGVRESWTFSIQPYLIGDKTLYGVVMSDVTQRDAGNTISDFQPFLRIGGVDYAGTNLGSSNIAPTPTSTLWTLNPSTNQPWTHGELAAMEAGLLTV